MQKKTLVTSAQSHHCELVAALLFHHQNTNHWYGTTVDDYVMGLLLPSQVIYTTLIQMPQRSGDGWHLCQN